MKNLKIVLLVAIVIVAIAFAAKADTGKIMVKSTITAPFMDTVHRFHSLLKDEKEGAYTGKEMRILVDSLFSRGSKSRAESSFKLGDDYARSVITNVLNKNFAKGQPLSKAEMLKIIRGSVPALMPANYATNPACAGEVERYGNDGHVTTWTRPIEPGDEWLTYEGKPWLLIRCGNGYILKPLVWKKVEQKAVSENATATAEAKVEVTVNVVAPAPAPVLPPAPPAALHCSIIKFSASPARVITRNKESIKAVWNSDCNCMLQLTDITYGNDAIIQKGLSPNGDYQFDPDLTPPNKDDKVWTAKYKLITCYGDVRTTSVIIDTRTWFGRNKAVWIPAAIVTAVGGAYLLLHKKDHSHDNSWVHDSNKSPWPSTGDGSTGTTFNSAYGAAAPTSVGYHAKYTLGFHINI